MYYTLNPHYNAINLGNEVRIIMEGFITKEV